jgi:hydroxymethylglutaryl-CoA synthase
MVGIVSYSAYIPRYRILLEDIAAAWEKDASEVIGGLGVTKKAVPAKDEDAVTIAIEAAFEALQLTSLDKTAIGAVFVGSESHPYAVNPTSTIVGELLGLGHNYLAADMEFACKAGTAGMRVTMGLIGNNEIELGLAIGTDAAQSKPHDALEYTSGAAAGAFILGNEHSPLVANCIATTSYSSDTPDFWRRDGIRYPSHAGRFTGEPAYFTHVLAAANQLLEKTNTKPSSITWCVFHSPNGKFPKDAAKRLGFTPEQLQPAFLVSNIGNPYSASSLVSFASVLDQAKPGDTIFMVSYGSGAGSDAFLWEVTDAIVPLQKKKQERKSLVSDFMNTEKRIDYVSYLKQTHKIP